jgi:Ca2+-binding EF-hand superfamily protein
MGCGASAARGEANSDSSDGANGQAPQAKPATAEASPKEAATAGDPQSEAPKVEAPKASADSTAELECIDALNLYFQEMEKAMDQELQNLRTIAKLKKAGQTEEIVEKVTEMKANRGAFKIISEKMLKEAFDCVDANDDGLICKEESQKLFACIVDENSQHLATMAKAEVRRLLARNLAFTKKMCDAPDEEAMKKQLEEEQKEDARREYEEIDRDMNTAIETYKKNKETCDKAAFKVLDASGDGRITRKEFMATFDPESNTYQGFLAALGLYDPNDCT